MISAFGIDHGEISKLHAGAGAVEQFKYGRHAGQVLRGARPYSRTVTEREAARAAKSPNRMVRLGASVGRYPRRWAGAAAGGAAGGAAAAGGGYAAGRRAGKKQS